MKKIILTFLFLFIGFVAFAQTPEEKADFLTSEMNTLLSLTAEQQAMVKITNRVYYRKNEKLVAKRDSNGDYLAIMAGTSTLSTQEQETILSKVNRITEERKAFHSNRMKMNLTSAQYTLYLQNIERLFALVVTQLGE
ncbi:hypothetical protein V9L05_04650 [Bernardetia sp. Wsw4-3y2]|uniref:hypothetical protein n=1 Tax=Bernardetia sp. Wsw4-3y2 TaxID=3127471 RepID=UPI0030D08A4E